MESRVRRMAARLSADRRVRFVAAGGSAAIAFYVTFTGTWLATGGRVPYLAVGLFANAVAALATYPIFRRYVFAASGPWLTGFLRFFATTLWSLAYNLGALTVLVELVGVTVLLAETIVIVTGPLITYQLHRLWVFRPAR